MMGRIASKDLDGCQFDVVIIGGGINGAAGAQQLAARGHSVLLVEKGDFGSGSSSRSSRLLHCGLRYLAPGRSPWEFAIKPSRLVTGVKMARMAIDARDEFIATTPTRVQLAKLYFPIFKGGAYSGWQVDAAFKVLEYFNRGKTPLNYRRITGRSAAAIPLVNRLGDFNLLDSVACYDEYQISWPERVTADIAIDAQRMGATTLNYTRADLLERHAAGWTIRLKDMAGTDQVTVTATCVVNTAGIWIDQVLAQHRSGKPPKILGTKGSHIVVRLPDDCRGVGVATINSKNEPFYCLPWGEHHYIGPTEVVYRDSLDDIRTAEAERDWLLAEANQLFPTFNLSARDVIFTWSGVRPLTWDPNLPGGNRNRVLHDLSGDGLEGVFAMTGGPLMTHRSAGVEIADAVCARLSDPSGPAGTPRFASAFPTLSPDDIHAALTGAVPAPQWLKTMAKEEMIVHLSDALLRRSGLPWFRKLEEAECDGIGRNLGSLLGWNESRVADEVALCKAELAALQRAASQSQAV
ncbi:FAD-dependent oxidoreductase [Cupriavidus taiwanensis]|uniref:FAD dependent oxidoreductase n=1 Tax=Cupriavidus taiwanensis TaxID=164546 RepID=A0A975XH54_9BURK|nr:FAD dependent oxidoreductase [Cupriavidus taiwanensis]